MSHKRRQPEGHRPRRPLLVEQLEGRMLLALSSFAPTIEPSGILITVIPSAGTDLATFGLRSSSVYEHDQVQLTGLFENGDRRDVHTVVIDWGDGASETVSELAAGQLGFSAAHRYADDRPGGNLPDTYLIMVTVRDDEGNSSTASRALQVLNAPPQFVGDLHLDQPVVNEGGSVTLSSPFADPGQLDGHTVEIDWGDANDPHVYPLNSGDRSFQWSHSYADDSGTDQYTIGVTLRDDDGGVATASTSVAVHNVVPVVSITGSTKVAEGSPLTLSAMVSDPGSMDTFRYEWLVTDGTQQLVRSESSPFTFAPVDDGAYVVHLSVTDDDGGVGLAAPIVVTADNVAPSIRILEIRDRQNALVQGVNEGSTISLGGRFSDAGVQDGHTLQVDWGDGSVVESHQLAAGLTDFAGIAHTYVDDAVPGTSQDDYSISVTVGDGDDWDTDSTTLTVRNVPPTARASARNQIKSTIGRKTMASRC